MTEKFGYPKRSLTRRLFFGVSIERFQGNGGGLYRLRARQRNAAPQRVAVIRRFAPSRCTHCHTGRWRQGGVPAGSSLMPKRPRMASLHPYRRGETADDGAETAAGVRVRCACDAMYPPLPPRGNARGLTRESRAGVSKGKLLLGLR